MSRSKRKVPKISITCIGTTPGVQHSYKKQESRAKRKKIKMLMKVGKYDTLPHDKEYGNPWSSPADGKQYFDDPKGFRK